jgi:hypothetical protein
MLKHFKCIFYHLQVKVDLLKSKVDMLLSDDIYVC